MSIPPLKPVESTRPELLQSWVPEDARLKIFTCRAKESGSWYAVAMDFNIAAMGESLQDAFVELVEQLECYFLACEADGMTFEQARQPVPLRRRLEYDLRVRMSTAGRRFSSPARASEWIVPARDRLDYVAHAH